MTQKTYEEDVVFTTGPAKLGARGQGGQCPHCKPIPVMRTGFSPCSISNREKPVFITGIPAKGQIISKAIFVFLTSPKKRTKLI